MPSCSKSALFQDGDNVRTLPKVVAINVTNDHLADVNEAWAVWIRLADQAQTIDDRATDGRGADATAGDSASDGCDLGVGGRSIGCRAGGIEASHGVLSDISPPNSVSAARRPTSLSLLPPHL